MYTAPVIIVGMHRSGTTMITKMLENLGLFVGDKKEVNNEALFFWDINNWVFDIAYCRADLPHNYRYMNPTTREVLIRDLNFFVASAKKKRFLGSKNSQYKSLKELDFPWGWKDPKNSFTIDLWKEVFPDAKVIHIYRNPMDSILSFMKRDLEMKNKFQLNWKKKFKRRFLISHNYNNNFRLHDLEEGYHLWEEYVSRCLDLEQVFPQMKQVRYEDFLQNPTPILTDLAEYCGLNSTNVDIKNQLEKVKSDRSFAFLNSNGALEVYHKIKNQPLMKQLDYDKII
ncbi:MAG: sulfotransferase [Chitinophagales bacterium]|nr:sulfotransferase [Chitinophagales bacterium]